MPPVLDVENWREWKVKITLGTLVAALLFALWFRGFWEEWHLINFMTKAEAQELDNKITSKIDGVAEMTRQNRQLIIENGNKFELFTAIQNLKEVDDAIFELEQSIRRDGETDETINRRRELDQRRERAKAYKFCVQRREPNCEQLILLD